MLMTADACGKWLEPAKYDPCRRITWKCGKEVDRDSREKDEHEVDGSLEVKNSPC